MNNVVSINLYASNIPGKWDIEVTKELSPEDGGWSKTFRVSVDGGMDSALFEARQIATSTAPEYSMRRRRKGTGTAAQAKGLEQVDLGAANAENLKIFDLNQVDILDEQED